MNTIIVINGNVLFNGFVLYKTLYEIISNIIFKKKNSRNIFSGNI